MKMESYSTEDTPFISFNSYIDEALINKISSIELNGEYEDIGLSGAINAFLWMGLGHKEELLNYINNGDKIETELDIPEELYEIIIDLVNEDVSIDYCLNSLIYLGVNYEFNYVKETFYKG